MTRRTRLRSRLIPAGFRPSLWSSLHKVLNGLCLRPIQAASSSDASAKAKGGDTGWGDSAGVAYSTLIADQLHEERVRKLSLEARAGQVVASSAVLAGLVFTTASLASTVTLERGLSAPTMLWGFAALVAAAFSGLVAAIPIGYDEADEDGLKSLLEEPYWSGPRERAEFRVAEMRLTVLQSARSRNGVKAVMVFLAVVAEVIAVALLGIAAWQALQ